jgi:hypothetical protein
VNQDRRHRRSCSLFSIYDQLPKLDDRREHGRLKVEAKPAAQSSPHWIKVKNWRYRQAEGREELFERG